MAKTQVCLREDELAALHGVAERSGRSVADFVREAIRRVWLRSGESGPLALWDGAPADGCRPCLPPNRSSWAPGHGSPSR